MRFADGVDSLRSLQQIWITPGQFRAAREVFFDQGRRDWGFPDGTSFAVMRELGIASAFTFDNDFQRTGSQVLPE